MVLASAGAVATQVPTNANAQNFSSAPIAQASKDEFEAIVLALQNERSTISLANDVYLRERCQESLGALAAAVAKAERAVSALRNETGATRDQALASSLGAIVSAIGLRLALAAAAGVTAPVSLTVVAVGLTIIVGGSLFALSLGRSGGNGLAVTSFASGRLSLLADVGGVAGRVGLVGATVGTIIDTGTAVADAGNYDRAAQRLEEGIVHLNDLRAEQAALSSDLGACREAMIADIDLTLEFAASTGVILP
ncbi:MAG: hypothetical protein AAGL24_27885 [Pseudomonadota bacterium]